MNFGNVKFCMEVRKHFFFMLNNSKVECYEVVLLKKSNFLFVIDVKFEIIL